MLRYMPYRSILFHVPWIFFRCLLRYHCTCENRIKVYIMNSCARIVTTYLFIVSRGNGGFGNSNTPNFCHKYPSNTRNFEASRFRSGNSRRIYESWLFEWKTCIDLGFINISINRIRVFMKNEKSSTRDKWTEFSGDKKSLGDQKFFAVDEETKTKLENFISSTSKPQINA